MAPTALITILVLSLSLSCLVVALPNLSLDTELQNESTMESYPPIVLDPFGKYTVSWEVDSVEEIVTFNIVVETQGYVGFGISKEGTMLGADIVAAEVEVTGEIKFTDFYGKDNQARPTEDTQQDWILESSSRNETHTHLNFSRAYDTGDTEGDVIIQAQISANSKHIHSYRMDEDTYFIWAISRNDNPELNEYHGTAANGARGSYKINILNPAAVTELPTTEPATTEDSVEVYPQIVLDPFGRYLLSWEVNKATETVTFHLEVETQGYVGFGISTEGTMAGAEIVAATIGDSGEIYMNDYHGGTGQIEPIVDDQQDWTWLLSGRNGTHTSLSFSRKFDTQDTIGDVSIEDEETYIIWAISQYDNLDLSYHGSAANGARGAYKVNILNPGAITGTPATPTTEEPSVTTPELPPTTEPATTEPATTEPATTEDPVEVYPQIALDPFGRYLLSWEVNKATETVTFHLEVETQGYVGFGISTEGTMAGADIVAATIGGSGEISMNDYHGGTGQIEPIVDQQQDWTWLLSGRNGTHTSLSFSRKFDTQDTIGDVSIEDEETYIIWAISRNDNPVLSYHGSAANGARGAYKINILNLDFSATPPSSTTTENPSTTTIVPTTTTPNPACKKCAATDSYEINWTACVGQVAVQDCPPGSSGSATWSCSDKGFIGATPNYEDCKSAWRENIIIPLNETIEEGEAEKYLNIIDENSRPGDIPQYFGHEIKEILSLGSQILRQLTENVTTGVVEAFTDKVVLVFGNVLNNEKTWLQLNGTALHNTSSQYVQNLEESMLQLATRATRNSSFPSKGRYDRKFDEKVIQIETGAKLLSMNERSNELSFPSTYSAEDSSYIKLPSDWANYFQLKDNVTFVGIQVQPRYVNIIFPKTVSSLAMPDKIINGNLMSFTFGTSNTSRNSNPPINFAGSGVSITFQHDVIAWGSKVKEIRRQLHKGERAKAVRGSSTCVYWNPDNLEWSSEGCKLVETQRSVTECECSHLTAFAVLFDVHKYVGKDLALSILTWILSPLSIICLIICIVVLTTSSFKALRSPRNEVTIHLCSCLLVANVLIVAFVDRDHFLLSEVLCTAFAVATHYFLLCAFSSMVLEGFILYKMVFIVFDNGKDRHKMMQYIAAYGIPALIVGITAIISVSLSDHAYGTDEFCWLDGNYIWGFLGPVALVVLGNSTMLVLTLVKAHDLVHNPKVEVNRQRKSFVSWIKGTFSLTILLGITWIFGFLMLINQYTVANIAAYLFTIFNASQGIFLFVFHIVMNKKIGKAVRRRLRLPGYLPKSSGTGTDASTRTRGRFNSTPLNSS